jgi:hypothetical protein
LVIRQHLHSPNANNVRNNSRIRRSHENKIQRGDLVPVDCFTYIDGSKPDCNKDCNIINDGFSYQQLSAPPSGGSGSGIQWVTFPK